MRSHSPLHNSFLEYHYPVSNIDFSHFHEWLSATANHWKTACKLLHSFSTESFPRGNALISGPGKKLSGFENLKVTETKARLLFREWHNCWELKITGIPEDQVLWKHSLRASLSLLTCHFVRRNVFSIIMRSFPFQLRKVKVESH